MNGEDQFENRLKTQMVKAIPTAWRQEILDAARAEAISGAPVSAPARSEVSPSRVGDRRSVPSIASRFPGNWSLVTSAATRVFSNLVWPSGKAWAGLAAVWVMIIGFNLANNDSSGATAASTTVPRSALVRELLQQQGRLFAELADPNQGAEPISPKRLAPGPRSDWKQHWGQA